MALIGCPMSQDHSQFPDPNVSNLLFLILLSSPCCNSSKDGIENTQ